MLREKHGAHSEDVGRSKVLLDATHDAAALLDTKGTILVMNAALAESFGLAPEEMLGRCVWDLVPDNAIMDRRRRLLEGVFRSGEPLEFEDTRSGRAFHTRVFPVFDDSHKVIELACFVRDVTAEKEASEAMERKNAAIAELLSISDRHRNELAQSVVENIEKLILPLVEDLKSGISGRDRETLDLLADRLLEITSPFAAHISHRFASLSPTEVNICDMIRRGMSTNEIAKHKHVSPATVSKHREHIRRKLGIQGEDINLVGHLNALFSENAGQ